MNEEIIKKCENIDKVKEDSSIIDKFEQIYSNFMVAKNSPKIPKIIKDEEPSLILKINDENEKNLCDDNLANLIMRKPLSQELDKNKNKKVIKSLIESSNRVMSSKNNKNKNKKDEKNKNKINIKEENEQKKKERKIKIQNIIEKMKQNRKKGIKSKEKRDMPKIKDKDKVKIKEKKGMKDIYKHLYGITDNNSISINLEKKYNNKNAYERLYNQGFYSKNKSQVNILENINKIKKESNYNNILEKSKNILGLNGGKKIKKYDKNNIYKPIKLNIKNKSTEPSFRPELNESTLRITKKMEEPFMRLTKPKNKTRVNTPKKIYSKKEDYEKCIKRINSLYLEGVEKLKKKKIKMKSCTPTLTPNHLYKPRSSLEEKKINMKDINKINYNLKSNIIKNSRNIYYKQIQWKKKIMFENIKKKKVYDDYYNYECTFKPEITKRNINKIFKKQFSDADINKTHKKNKNYFDIYFGPKLREFSVSKQRYFIINNDDINSNNISLYNKSNKNCESEKRNKYNEDNIKLSLIKRKLYNLEQFFSKKII